MDQPDEITAKAAQLWCLPQHQHKVMDPDLCQSIIELCRKCASDARREAFKETLKKWQRMDGLHSAGIFYDWLESQAKGGA